MSRDVDGKQLNDDTSSSDSRLITNGSSDSPSIVQLFLTWLRIGFTSFGGGGITQYLIQENFIHKRKWITDEEYTRILGMCQITPGMVIVAITILIGKRLGGGVGIAVSLAGLIFPSAVITIGMTAIYANFSELPQVKAALRSVFAAIFGISLATNWRNAKPVLLNSRKRGLLTFLAALGIMLGSAAIYIRFDPPVSVLYLLGGLCGALAYWLAAKKNKED
jgi:chromate transporter